MGDSYPRFKAAAVMAAPVFLDREATTDKACALIREAAGEGAELIAFPETFLPGYPYWIWLGTPTWGAPFFSELFRNAVEIGSPTTDRLCAAARAANAHVVMGINERDGGTLYNTQLFIGRDGKILGRHRKLQPTLVERTVWGRGDGSDLRVFPTDIGTLGGLICWEHTMDLVRYALIALGEEIHIAAWPGTSTLNHNPHSEIFNDANEAAVRHHALAGQTFVISVQNPIDDAMIEKLGLSGQPEMIEAGGGWSAIVGPDGQFLAGPLTGEEGIIYADIDLGERILAKYACDSLGHYARPDIVRLAMDTLAQPITTPLRSAIRDTGEPASRERTSPEGDVAAEPGDPPGA
jgi:aliphatic nitrilase